MEVTQPDPGQQFKIYQSLIFSHPDGKDTYLRVILCTGEVEELDEIFNEIKIFHEKMNGTSNSLTIFLFKDKIELENCREMGIKVYKKEKKRDMKKQKKQLVVLGLAVMLAANASAPVYAAVTNRTADGLVYTDNDQNIHYPLWIWVNGYCYYYQNAATILKNTTTPDGYTVDAEGRWTVNGVPQTNGYGGYAMGTADYAGKTNDEIWSIMKSKLEPVFLAGIPMSTGATASILPDEISFDIGTGGVVGNDINVYHNNGVYGTFITATIGNDWSDMVDATGASTKTIYAQKPYIKEKTIKAVVGDQIGQELFNYIRAHADKTTPGYITETDENGNPIYGWFDPGVNGEPDKFIIDPNGTDTRSRYVENCGDGIYAQTLDLSMWQNRTTDYGKRFSVVYDSGLKIHVYN